MNEIPRNPPRNPDEDALDLETFFPYQITVLTRQVSNSLAKTYVDRFGITIPEWRVMAALGRYPNATASHVVRHTGLDKVQVSRAVALLADKGHVARRPDPEDRRNAFINFTTRGRRTYREIVPVARAYEERLLATITPEQRQMLNAVLDELTARAEEL